MSTHQSIHFLLTALTPLSHHSAGVGEKGNVSTLNRREQFVARPAADAPTPEEIAAFCAAHPVPVEVWEALRLVEFPTYVAVALVKLLIEQYGGGEGTGLLSGVDRYEMLAKRLQSAAVASPTLRRLWEVLCRGLQLPLHPQRLDAALLRFWALTPALQSAASAAAIEETHAVVALARLWSAQEKLRNPDYAQAAGQLELVDAALIRPTYTFAPTAQEQPSAGVAVVSANTVRHQMVRAPLWAHLCRRLGVPVGTPGQGALPLAVESIFDNGGNIRAGAKQPANPHALKWSIRGAYPALDLLGGVTDSFDLGKSRLDVFAHLVCRENGAALANAPDAVRRSPMAAVSAAEMVDLASETRQATPSGEGQMIRSFEVLKPGTQIHVWLALDPWTTQPTRGALACALAEYEQGTPILGGQAARGYGLMGVERLADLPTAREDAAAYEEYLAGHKEALLAGLLDGTLGCGKVICS